MKTLHCILLIAICIPGIIGGFLQKCISGYIFGGLLFICALLILFIIWAINSPPHRVANHRKLRTYRWYDDVHTMD